MSLFLFVFSRVGLVFIVIRFDSYLFVSATNISTHRVNSHHGILFCVISEFRNSISKNFIYSSFLSNI